MDIKLNGQRRYFWHTNEKKVQPKSPWDHSEVCTKWAGTPIDDNEPARRLAINPDLPEEELKNNIIITKISASCVTHTHKNLFTLFNLVLQQKQINSFYSN